MMVILLVVVPVRLARAARRLAAKAA